jgi:hypothetical protein
MKLQLRIAPNEVSLRFSSVGHRDSFWHALANNPVGGFSPQQAAQRVGSNHIRFFPEKMKAGYDWPFQSLPAPILVEADGEPVTKPVAVVQKPPEKTIPASAIRPPEPIAPIATLPAEVLESPVPQSGIEQPAQQFVPEPPPSIVIPQVASVAEMKQAEDNDPEPPDRRTKAWKQWNGRKLAAKYFKK